LDGVVAVLLAEFDRNADLSSIFASSFGSLRRHESES